MKLNINFKELDIHELSNLIFEGQSKVKNSIPLCLEDNNIEDNYKLLLQLFTNGMKIKYGDDNGIVNLCDLEYDDYKYIQIYFESIGYTFHYRLCDIDDKELNLFLNKKIINEKKLSDYIFNINIKDTNQIFILWFEKLI